MKSRPAAITFIFITVMLDMLALGLIAPVLPKLILNFLGGNATSAATWLGVFGTVFALMQFFFSPVLGVLSDRFGRRPVILLSNLGLGLDYIVMALSPTIGWLFVGRVISGITASSVPTAMAYIADVVPKEKRAGAFGMIGVAFGVGFILGPGIAATRAPQRIHVAPSQPGRLARFTPIAFRIVEARDATISRLRLARSFRYLGALCDLSLRLESNYNRHFTCAGWRVHVRDFRRTHWTGRRVVGRTAHTLYRTIFRRSRNGHCWSGQNRRALSGFNSGDFDVEHFLPGSARNDDSPCERTGTG